MSAILRKAFSFPVVLGALLVAATFMEVRPNLPDPDTWWHLAVGEDLLVTQSWPTADTYSFTVRGEPWIAYEWLGEAAIALAHRLDGVQGMFVLMVVLSEVVLLLLYWYSYLRSGSFTAAFVACLVLLTLAEVSLDLRPQVLGYIFLLVTLICLERFRRGRPKALWPLPAVFLLWVNTHGTFMLGLAALGWYWVSGLVEFRAGGLEAKRCTTGERRQLAVVSLLCVVALTITPYGTRLAAYPLEMMFFQSLSIRGVTEWQPLPFDLLIGKLFLVLVILFLLALVVFRPGYRLEEIGLLILAIYAATVHRRFLLFFVVVFAPLLATLLGRWLRYQPAKDPYILNAVVLALLGVGLVKAFPSIQQINGGIDQAFPHYAVRYLREHPAPGPMLNAYTWGGYLIWKLEPEPRVFIDSRADVYDYGGVLRDYFRIAGLDRQVLALLRVYGIQACLIGRRAPLATYLAAFPSDWERVYADNLSAVFVRKHRGSASRAPEGERPAPSRLDFPAAGPGSLR